MKIEGLISAVTVEVYNPRYKTKIIVFNNFETVNDYIQGLKRLDTKNILRFKTYKCQCSPEMVNYNGRDWVTRYVW